MEKCGNVAVVVADRSRFGRWKEEVLFFVLLDGFSIYSSRFKPKKKRE